MAEDEIEDMTPQGEDHNPFENKKVDEKIKNGESIKLLEEIYMNSSNLEYFIQQISEQFHLKLCCVADLYHFVNLCVKVPSSAFDYCLIYAKMSKEQNYVRIYLIL